MTFLVDTNVLLRSAQPSHPMYAFSVNATNTLLGRGEELCIAPQNLIEFWNVYTRPVERNGLGHTVTEASTEVNRLKELFPLLLDLPAIYEEWERLVIAPGSQCSRCSTCCGNACAWFDSHLDVQHLGL